MKKRGFGVNKWNGVGGKLAGAETFEEAVIRETKEEIGIDILNLSKYAEISFKFENGLQIFSEVFLSDSWSNDPAESEEMMPKLYDIQNIPYDHMWGDDKEWLPLVLDFEKLRASFEFDLEDNIIKREIVKIKEF